MFPKLSCHLVFVVVDWLHTRDWDDDLVIHAAFFAYVDEPHLV